MYLTLTLYCRLTPSHLLSTPACRHRATARSSGTLPAPGGCTTASTMALPRGRAAAFVASIWPQICAQLPGSPVTALLQGRPNGAHPEAEL